MHTDWLTKGLLFINVVVCDVREQTWQCIHGVFSLLLLWDLGIELRLSCLHCKQSYSLSHSIGLEKIFEKIKSEWWSSQPVTVTHIRDNHIIRRKGLFPSWRHDILHIGQKHVAKSREWEVKSKGKRAISQNHLRRQAPQWPENLPVDSTSQRLHYFMLVRTCWESSFMKQALGDTPMKRLKDKDTCYQV